MRKPFVKQVKQVDLARLLSVRLLSKEWFYHAFLVVAQWNLIAQRYFEIEYR